MKYDNDKSSEQWVEEHVVRFMEKSRHTEQELTSLRAFLSSQYLDVINFQQVCDNLYDGIHITDGEGRVLFINRAYTRTTGIRPEELLGRKVSDIEKEGLLYNGSVTERVIRQKKRVNSVATIHRLNKKVLVTGNPVFDESGALKMVVTNTRDFLELKQLEAKLLFLSAEQQGRSDGTVSIQHKTLCGVGGQSAAMQAVMKLVCSVAPTDATVLITGESGTGKEVIANEIVQRSQRSDKPFVKLNCAAIPGALLESELFGYEEGAFTGAKRAGKRGLFEVANGGVILLDEVGDMPLDLQAKLLRVLQSKTMLRIGGSKPVELDVRLIASTNKDLQEEVRKGRFREDLYYRLNVVPVALPPLRERREEIPALTEYFCQAFSKKYGRTTHFTQEALVLMQEYSWPGNIRELENLVERMVILCYPHTVTGDDVAGVLFPQGTMGCPAQGTLKEQVQAFERQLILKTLRSAGSMRKAAQMLGVDHSTIVKKCRQYGLSVERSDVTSE